MPVTEIFNKTSEGYLLKTIAMETIITSDGKLPSGFREAFGRRAKVVVLIDEQEQRHCSASSAQDLMDMAGKVKAFQHIEDPVEYQRTLRDEWTRQWEK
jgi:hypothetical protein